MNPNQAVDNSNQDWTWIQSFQAGDRSGFDQIFRKYKSIVINLSFRFVKDQGIAEEIAQEVFVKIYEKKVKSDPKSKFSTWLYRVTVNASLDFLRHRKKIFYTLDQTIKSEEGNTVTFLETVADPKASHPIAGIEKEELRQTVQREIDLLPENLKTPLLLFQFEEMPYREIAQILGVSEKAVERRLCHAKEALRKKLSKYV